MLTPREVLRNAFRGAIFEAEDVLCAVDDVDLVAPKPARFALAKRELHKRLVWKTSKALSWNLAFQPIHLTRDYDLFVAYLPLSQDLTHLAAIKSWKSSCRTSVCWIDELWAADLPDLKKWLPLLDEFDHVVLGYRGTVEPLSKILGRECHFLPMAVDALRFSPYPRRLSRRIDILSVGRRWPEIHRACADLAKQQNIFYVHDTFNASYSVVEDHREHRDMLADMMKRSRFFVVAPAKIGTEEGSRGQVEVGLRYYEGAAAGTVMIGQAPVCDAYRTLFNWPDAVVEVSRNGSDVAETVTRLAADPDRMEQISRRNAAGALLQHDWVYRWERIIEIAGLTPAPALLARKARLAELAQMASSGRAPAYRGLTASN